MLTQLPTRRRLRALRKSRCDDVATLRRASPPLAVALGVHGDWLADPLTGARTFGLLWKQVQRCGSDRPHPLLPAAQAIQQLQALSARHTANGQTVRRLLPPSLGPSARRNNTSSR